MRENCVWGGGAGVGRDRVDKEGGRKEVAIKKRKKERAPKGKLHKTNFRSQQSHFLQLYTPLSHTENNIQSSF